MRYDYSTVVLLLLDLSAVFDTVDHSIILHRLKKRFGIKGRVLVQNLPGWSESICLPEWNQFQQVWFNVWCSPWFCSWPYFIYFVYVSSWWRHNINFHFYADDSHVYFSFDSDSSIIVPRIDACLHDIATSMSFNKLKLMVTRQSFWA